MKLTEDWDEEDLEKYALDNIGDMVSANFDALLVKIAKKYPGASLGGTNTEVVDYSYTRGRDWSDLSVNLKTIVPVIIPTTPEAADALADNLPDDLIEILDEIELTEGQPTGMQYKGELINADWGEIGESTANSDLTEVTVPVELNYTYHHEDSKY